MPVWHKSEVLRCIQLSLATVQVLNMAAVVHMVCSSSVKLFAEYLTQYLVPFMITPSVTCIDTMWDTYSDASLKSLAHQHRGTRPLVKVQDTKLVMVTSWSIRILRITALSCYHWMLYSIPFFGCGN